MFDKKVFFAQQTRPEQLLNLSQTEQDEYWMSQALLLAEQAAELGEVPVAALLVQEQELIGVGFNTPISSHNACAHAEIIALADAGQTLGNYRLPGAQMYVTIEPCMMCAGALVHARIARLIYGATEPKAGAVESHQLLNQAFLNHQVEVRGGVKAEQCGERISRFFRQRRQQQQRPKHLL